MPRITDGVKMTDMGESSLRGKVDGSFLGVTFFNKKISPQTPLKKVVFSQKAILN
jgi:hypothetical protein